MDLSRKTAFDVLLNMEKENSYSNLTLNRFIKQNKPENQGFTRELVYGVLENKLLLDYYLDALIKSGIKKTGKKEATLLRMGLYQIIFMDSVPEYAAVNETVNMAKRLCRGREGFINGVLRGYMKKEIPLPKKRKDFLCVKYSFPGWITDLWSEQYGEDMCENLLEASNKRPRLSIRVNIMKTNPDLLTELLQKKGFDVSKGRFSGRILHVKGTGLLDLKEYKEGLFSVQDEASALAADMSGAEAGDYVIDVCAAPGGKTAAIGEMMNNQGTIKSFDIYEHKLSLIKEQADRLGLKIIDTGIMDGSIGSVYLKEKADKVLADVPCSGLGVIRHKPEIKYKEPKNLKALYEIQAAILEKSSEYLKNGGTLIYSTCTINDNENGNQIREFMKRHDDFKIEAEKQFLPVEDIDGFYICKMIKKG
ncbi:MAG: 16S rRNA (cytosine(967)-C(5))-methyltransferase RsmB [Clostridiales bacterium]|nr:16S rRNA (cytosine(967)-C(5))-methyltransferase RsmB [Bacillota bacterium]MEE0517395.1 16S rRNA (cytosine(967)-C(5))-methyltransferase RsmB [Anaerovoracaceae bacterium]PWL94538.1 MAG: 16S rRNA (cytosine(967)-C(5))-methyltransferase RsmB [Clostridiales bacterium]